MTITIKIPLKNGTEITAEGDMNYLKEAISNFGELFEVLETAIGEISIGTKEPIIITGEENESPPEEKQPDFSGSEYEIPSIPTDTTKNLRRSITYLLETPWGKTPKGMNDIREALETNAVYRSTGSIAGSLTQLVQKGELRRIKGEKGKWEYVKR